MPREIKITVVGNSSVGKTCMLLSYATNSFPTEYVPTVFDNYNTKVVVEGTPVDLVLFDTAGDAEYDSIRPLNYADTGVFLICFSVVNPKSAEGVVKKWVDEIRNAAGCAEAPIVLVGTKIDLRDNAEEKKALKADTGMDPLTKDQGQTLAKAIGASKYVECSALTQEGLPEVFTEAVKVVLFPKPLPKPEKEKAKECNVM